MTESTMPLTAETMTYLVTTAAMTAPKSKTTPLSPAMMTWPPTPMTMIEGAGAVSQVTLPPSETTAAQKAAPSLKW